MRSLDEYLKILNLVDKTNISKSDIDDSYKSLSKKFHPDTTSMAEAKDGHLFILLKEARDYVINNLDYVNEYLYNLDLKKDKRSDKEFVYDEAVNYYNEGLYDEAYKLFDLLNEFKDSRRYKIKSQAGIIFSRYKKAKEFFNQKKYEEALFNLNTIKGYEDVDDLINKCNEYILYQNIYNNALELFNNEQYLESHELFKKINYLDSKKMADKCLELDKCKKQYKKALDYFNDEKFDLARDIFKENLSYKDSKIMFEKSNKLFIEKNKYNDALTLINEGKYRQACDVLSFILDYKDSNNLLNKYKGMTENYMDSNYSNALFFLDNKDYINAHICLNKCIDYKDSRKLIIDNMFNYDADITLRDAKEYLDKIKLNKSIFGHNKQMSNIRKIRLKLNKIVDFKDTKLVLDKYDIISSSIKKLSYQKFAFLVVLLLITLIIIISILIANLI